MNEKYCYSWDGEKYHGEFDTEKEALEDAKVDSPDVESVYIGIAESPKLRWCSNEEEIIESIIENLYEDIGEYAEDFEVSRSHELELAEMIDETVKRWIDKNKIKPSGYVVYDSHEVQLTGINGGAKCANV